MPSDDRRHIYVYPRPQIAIYSLALVMLEIILHTQLETSIYYYIKVHALALAFEIDHDV
jgi:hypothetical protein